MGADIKNLRNRIHSVESTLHLTKAMGLVASSKIRRAQSAMKRSKEYRDSVNEIINMLTSCSDCQKSAYLMEHSGKKTKVVVIAGDRGLAGGYNSNIMRFVRDFGECEIVAIGKKSCEKFSQTINSSEKMEIEEVNSISKTLCEDYLSGEYSKIGVIYTEYISMLSQVPVVKWLFPLSKTENQDKISAIFEPDEQTILEQVVPTYVTGVIYSALKESFLSEVSARRTAMDSAGKNANSILDDLQLKYNRARQGSITQEITEIVAGSGD